MSFFIALPFLLFSSAAAGEKQYAGVLPAGWDAGREAWLRCLKDTGVSVEEKIDTGKRDAGQDVGPQPQPQLQPQTTNHDHNHRNNNRLSSPSPSPIMKRH